MVSVVPVKTRRQQSEFLDLPEHIYQDTPQWVPRIRSSERELLGYRQHGFYQQAEAASFLAYRERDVCGRVLAVCPRQQPAQAEGMGFLGFYESVDDEAVANALFDSSLSWLAKRGITQVRGPVSPSMNYEAGLLVDGFEQAPTFMMPYSHPSYPALWQNYGFQKAQDLFAFTADTGMLSNLNEKMRRICFAAEERFGATFRQIDRRRFQQDVATFLTLYNSASQSTWGFAALSDAEIRQLSGELKHLIIPELTCFVEVEGRIVGAAFAMLDYNPLIKKIQGRLFPFGFLRLLLQRRQLKRTRVMSINVLPEFQRWGLGLSLMGYLARAGLAWGLQEVEFSYVLESNHLARTTLQNGGARCDKTYRVYELQLDQTHSSN